MPPQKRLLYPFQEMKIGDSFFVPCSDEKKTSRTQNRLSNACIKGHGGGKFSSHQARSKVRRGRSPKDVEDEEKSWSTMPKGRMLNKGTHAGGGALGVHRLQACGNCYDQVQDAIANQGESCQPRLSGPTDNPRSEQGTGGGGHFDVSPGASTATPRACRSVFSIRYADAGPKVEFRHMRWRQTSRRTAPGLRVLATSWSMILHQQGTAHWHRRAHQAARPDAGRL